MKSMSRSERVLAMLMTSSGSVLLKVAFALSFFAGGGGLLELAVAQPLGDELPT